MPFVQNSKNSLCSLEQFFKAIESENLSSVNYSLTHLQAVDKSGYSALAVAIMNISVSGVLDLLEAAVSANFKFYELAQPKNSRSQGLISFLLSFYKSSIEYTLDNRQEFDNATIVTMLDDLLGEQTGFHPDFKDGSGSTPLSSAIKQSCLEGVCSLIEKHKANAHVTDQKGNTLLHQACLTDSIDASIIHYLVIDAKLNSCLYIKNADQLTPLECLERYRKDNPHSLNFETGEQNTRLLQAYYRDFPPPESVQTPRFKR